MDQSQKFANARFDDRYHLGNGDIRISLAWQEEIVSEIQSLRSQLDAAHKTIARLANQVRAATVESEG